MSSAPDPPRRPVVAPSLLAADFGRLADEVASVEAAGADWLHLDVMDGHFVDNISFGPAVVAAMKKSVRIPLDVHLMISRPDHYLKAFAEAGADHIHLHIEAGPNTHRSLQVVRSLGLRAGIALNPATPAEAVGAVLDLADMILVMTVNPGFGGQGFIPSQLDKIRRLRRMADDTGRHLPIIVDGGIDAGTAARCVAAGADTLVAGTGVFGQQDYAAAIAGLHAAAAISP